jgi:hypothetical protein
MVNGNEWRDLMPVGRDCAVLIARYDQGSLHHAPRDELYSGRRHRQQSADV